MAAIINKPALLLLLLLLFSTPLPPSSGSQDGYTITGQVRIPQGVGGEAFASHEKSSNVKVILNGGQSVTFLKPDGNFSFYNVPSGTHLIEVVAIGFFFSPVWSNVNGRNISGKVEAALTHNRRVLSDLVMEPLRKERYYQIRRPFSIMSVVKTPMGIMLGLMLILVVIMPKLMENMDPEELKRAQEEMKNQRVTSFLSLLISKAGRRLYI